LDFFLKEEEGFDTNPLCQPDVTVQLIQNLNLNDKKYSSKKIPSPTLRQKTKRKLYEVKRKSFLKKIKMILI